MMFLMARSDMFGARHRRFQSLYVGGVIRVTVTPVRRALALSVMALTAALPLRVAVWATQAVA